MDGDDSISFDVPLSVSARIPGVEKEKGQSLLPSGQVPSQNLIPSHPLPVVNSRICIQSQGSMTSPPVDTRFVACMLVYMC